MSSAGKGLEEPKAEAEKKEASSVEARLLEAAVKHQLGYDKAPEDQGWNWPTADGRLRSWAGGPDKQHMDWSKYREGFAWYDPNNAETFDGYKLPHHDISHDGHLVVVLRGVMSAGAAIQGSRGGVDIPEADVDAVKAHLAKHYREFDRTPPWEQQKASEPVQVKEPQGNLEVDKKMPENTIEGKVEAPVEKPTIAESKGKGLVAAEAVSTMEVDQRRVLRESVVRRLKGGSLKEQWEAPIGLAPAPASRLRNFVIVSEVMAGKAGDTVTVPYVKDFDMDILEEVGHALTPKTGLTGTVTTDLKEAAATTDVSYADVDKMTEDVMAQLEAKFEQASYRAEDKDLLDLLIADADVPEVDHSSDTTADFKASYIAEALGKLMGEGKEVNFGDAVVVINAAMYEKLLEDIAGSTALAFARPDAIRDGQIRQLMGVNISTANYLPTTGTTTKKYSAYLIHKNALVLAPKRELLIETERNTRDRQVKLTGSHTFGDKILDDKAAVEIKTAFVAP
jgi:hypothetical protein